MIILEIKYGKLITGIFKRKQVPNARKQHQLMGPAWKSRTPTASALCLRTCWGCEGEDMSCGSYLFFSANLLFDHLGKELKLHSWQKRLPYPILTSLT